MLEVNDVKGHIVQSLFEHKLVQRLRKDLLNCKVPVQLATSYSTHELRIPFRLDQDFRNNV